MPARPAKVRVRGLSMLLLKRRIALERCPYCIQSQRKTQAPPITPARRTLQRLTVAAFISVPVLDNRRLRVFVDMQRENIGSGIVANHIEIEFASRNVSQIKLRRQDALLIVVGASKHLTQGTHDATASTRDDGLRVISERSLVVRRIIAPPGKLIAGEDEAAPFQRDMLHGGKPAVSSIGGRGAVELDAFGIHGHPQQGHIVLPADDRSQPSQWGLEDGKRGAIAEAPDQPLGSGGHELAMLAQVASLRREKQHGTVERPSISLDHANNQIDLLLPGNVGKDINSGAGDIDRTVPVATILFPSLCRAIAHHRSERQTPGIGRNKGFREDHQLRSLAGRLLRQCLHFLQRALAVKGDRGCLHDCSAHALSLCYHSSFSYSLFFLQKTCPVAFYSL